MNSLQLSKCLAEETRLRVLLLLQNCGELCVCDLCDALGQAQPKVSRHLAQLRDCCLIQARRQGKWMFYRLHPELPLWAVDVLSALQRGDAGRISSDHQRVQTLSQSATDRC